MITTGVRKNFSLVYEVLDKSARNVRSIKDAVKKASEIYLATDPEA